MGQDRLSDIPGRMARYFIGTAMESLPAANRADNPNNDEDGYPDGELHSLGNLREKMQEGRQRLEKQAEGQFEPETDC